MKELLIPGLLMVQKAFKRNLFGYHKYEGNFEVITAQILKDCYYYSKKYQLWYFAVSSGHFQQFYCRDFGMITRGLLELGYQKEVRSTLLYALNIFAEHNRVATTISCDLPVDIYEYGTDSLPFLLRSIRLYTEITQDISIIKEYGGFLQRMITIYEEKVYDPKTKLVRSDRSFSSIKDHYVRRNATYDCSAMLGLVVECRLLSAWHPLRSIISLSESLKEMKQLLWNGKAFYDDEERNVVSSDANIFPFYWSLFPPAKSALDAIRKLQLDLPLPVKYTAVRKKHQEGFWLRMITPNYEGTTVWMHLGLCYLEVLETQAPEYCRELLEKVVTRVEKQKNFIELYDEAKPYRTIFYCADESLSWIAGFTALSRRLCRTKNRRVVLKKPLQHN